MKDLTVVIVTRNCAALMPALLDRLPAECAVIVADNASTDDTRLRVERVRPDALIMKCDAYIGFARSANRAMAAAKTPFVLLLMPCAWLMANALQTLRTAALARPSRPVLRPRLIDEFGAGLDAGPAGGKGGSSTAFDYRANTALFIQTDALKVRPLFDEAFLHFGEAADLLQRVAAEGEPADTVPDAGVICPQTGVPGGQLMSRQYAHLEWSGAKLLEKRLGTEQAAAAIRARLEKIDHKATWKALVGSAHSAKEYRWRAYGLTAYLDGKSADDLQFELVQLPG